MIITRTPLRISLVGGGTDMPSFYERHPGAVVSFTINKYVYVSVNPKFDGTFRVSYSKTENVDLAKDIEHRLVRDTLEIMNVRTGLEITSIADIPGEGTGLGSSSAFTVGLVNALENMRNDNFQDNIDRSILAERAYLIERMSNIVGKQDQYAAAWGGLNYFGFKKNSTVVSPIKFYDYGLFENHMLLLWTGKTRSSNQILKEQSRGFSDGRTFESGKYLANLAEHLRVDLAGGCTMQRLGEYLHESWNVKKRLAEGITDPQIDQWYNQAMRAGAYGGKLLGAGGGGFMLFVARPDTHKAICFATGLREIEFEITIEGSEVMAHG